MLLEEAKCPHVVASETGASSVFQLSSAVATGCFTQASVICTLRSTERVIVGSWSSGVISYRHNGVVETVPLRCR